MKIKLLVKPSPTESFEWEHTGPEFRIGRQDTCELRFRGEAAQLVSGQHVLVQLFEGGASLTDLESTNGTFLNGARVTQPVMLTVGDEIHLGRGGPRLEVVVIDTASDAASPPPLAAAARQFDPRRRYMLWGGISVAVAAVLVVTVLLSILGNEDEVAQRDRPTGPGAAGTAQPTAKDVVGSSTREADRDVDAREQPGVADSSTEPTDSSSAQAIPPEPPAESSPMPPAVQHPATEGAEAATADSPSPPVAESVGPALAQADFLMVNPDHLAVVIDAEGDGFRVLAKSQGEDALDLINQAFDQQIPRISRDRSLSRRVFNAVVAGQEVPQALADELKKYYKVHRFVLVEPDEAPRFVAFQEKNSKAYRVGFYMRHNTETLDWIALNGQPESVPRSHVVPGTGKIGLGDKLLPAVGELDFLDYCLLNTAQKLGSPEGEPGHVFVAVHVDMDALKPFAARIQADSWSWRVYAGILNEFGVKLPSTRAEEAFHELQTCLKHLEDEVINKLTAFGIDVIEREEIARLLGERQLAETEQFETKNYGRLACASHIVLAEISFPLSGGTYHVNVRLIDANNGVIVWGEKRDRVIRPRATTERFLLESGRLAVIEFENGLSPRPGSAMPLFPQPFNVDDSESLRQRLVYIEGPEDAQSLGFRELFGKRVYRLPRDAVREVSYVRQLQDVPSSDRMRFLVRQIARQIVPRAGCVSEVNTDSATIALGRASEIAAGQRMKVLRLDPTSTGDDAARTEQRLLDVELTVTDVHDSHSIASFDDLGLESLWSESMEPGDIAFLKGATLPLVVVRPFSYVQPSREVNERLVVRTPARAQRIQRDTVRAASLMQDLVKRALRKLDIPAIEKDDEAPADNAVTHIVSGTVSPTEKELQFDFTFSVQPAGATELSREFKLKLTQVQIDRWTP